MPKNDNTLHLTKRQASQINRGNRNLSGNINALMDNLSVMTHGIPRSDKIDSLADDFKSLLSSEMSDITKTSDGDTTSFITKLFSENNKKLATEFKDMENMFNANDGQLQAFINEQYRNRLIKQADLHEIASQLIELQQAITITRDAIISADVVDGHMSRTLTFDGAADGSTGEEYIPIVEQMEKTFKLQRKVKNFIIPRALEYGEYAAYCIPYSKIFEDFSKEKRSSNGQYLAYSESVKGKTLGEMINKKSKINLQETIMESVEIPEIYESMGKADIRKGINKELDQYLENITISNDPIPLSVLEEGVGSSREYYQEFVEKTFTEDNKEISFQKIMAGVDNGIHLVDSSDEGGKKRTKKGESFKNISDCYVKLIDPMHLLPIRIMDEVIGYYYIQEEDITPLSGILTSTVYYDKFDNNRNENNVLSTIAEAIVSAFDKKFLEKNVKFKKLIVEALSYFKLNNRKIRFQFIPKEYIIEFKVNENEHGEGVSMIEPSLFYAKLYLMLLLFKIMSIILNSNDTKVNYIKQSGIEANVANKIQEIAREKQKRQITLADMFSYTTLVNKIGQGNEMYVPVGKSNERGIETEILSGQDVQLNNELMEMLKKAYIAGTGVPDVLMNYLNEADFAKTLELANNRFQGLVVSLQLDFNEQITEFYKAIMRHATTIPENIIDTFKFNFLQPKASNSNVTSDLINNHNAIQDFLVLMYFGDQSTNDDPKTTAQINNFKKLLAKERLPMLHWDKLDGLFKEATTGGIADTLKTNNTQDNTEG